MESGLIAYFWFHNTRGSQTVRMASREPTPELISRPQNSRPPRRDDRPYKTPPQNRRSTTDPPGNQKITSAPRASGRVGGWAGVRFVRQYMLG